MVAQIQLLQLSNEKFTKSLSFTRPVVQLVSVLSCMSANTIFIFRRRGVGWGTEGRAVEKH